MLGVCCWRLCSAPTQGGGDGALVLEPFGLGAAQEQEGRKLLPALGRAKQTSQIQRREVSLTAVCELDSLKWAM